MTTPSRYNGWASTTTTVTRPTGSGGVLTAPPPTALLAINVVAAVSPTGLYRGSSLAWKVLPGYGVAGILWCIAELVFWSEEESLVFGAANVLPCGW